MSFYDAGFDALFRSALNGVNNFPFDLTKSMYQIVDPRLMDRGSITPLLEGTNTQATVRGTGVENINGESYSGSTPVYYTRLDLGILFKGVYLEWESQSTNTRDFAAWLSNNMGIPATPEDILEEVIPAGASNSYITIKADPESLWFTGDCKVFYTRGKADLGDLISPDWASGIHKTLPPQDANYVLTYNHDYTGGGEQYRAAAKTTTDQLRLKIWGMIMGSLPIQWNQSMKVNLLEGEANVVAAGGAKGFKSLFQIPALNIWVHFND
jgi:hypothetical protein